MKTKLIKEKMKAVHDQDLAKFLETLGILDKLKRKELKCKFCGKIMTIEKIHSLFPQSGSIKLVCDSLECIRVLHTLLREGKISI